MLLTGIGGQGVQLAAKILALAATSEGRSVMSLGTFGGSMRGGNTDSTVVIADGPISSPPLVSRSWSAIVVHPKFWQPVREKLRPEAVVVYDSALIGDLGVDLARKFPIDASLGGLALGFSRFQLPLGFPVADWLRSNRKAYRLRCILKAYTGMFDLGQVLRRRRAGDSSPCCRSSLPL